MSTRFMQENERTKHLDWPDIEMHLVPADVVADGGRYFRQLAGLSDQVSSSVVWTNSSSNRGRYID